MTSASSRSPVDPFTATASCNSRGEQCACPCARAACRGALGAVVLTDERPNLASAHVRNERAIGGCMRELLAVAAVLCVAIACGSADTSPPPATGQSDAGAPVGDGGSSGGPGDAGTGSGGDAGTSADAGAPSGGSDGGAGSGGGTSDAGSGGGTSDSGSGRGSGDGTDGGTVAQGPEVLTSGENAIALAIDANNVYWLNIRTVPTSGQTYKFVDV